MINARTRASEWGKLTDAKVEGKHCSQFETLGEAKEYSDSVCS